jgi:hypothetical protein
MTELAQVQPARQVTPGRAAVVRPDEAAARHVAVQSSGRASARAALDSALSGVDLTEVDRRFLSRLSQWDKRNAAFVASLVTRARHRGRSEAALSPRQLQTVLAALADAVEYRTSGASATGCWVCANRASGLCAEHTRDADRARVFADLATALSGQSRPAGLARLGAIPDFRQRTSVAS